MTLHLRAGGRIDRLHVPLRCDIHRTPPCFVGVQVASTACMSRRVVMYHGQGDVTPADGMLWP
jgi:hypothetical protein